uniref:SDR family NAD(P)-dependent oxidoreductase n=1 Tax=Anaerostipes butyraticus TaxID=645466 RepID=UPI0023A8C511
MLREISLEGKTALITGGGTGIGFAIAAEMADAGANIVIVGRREEKLRKAAQKIGKKCSWYRFDVTKTEEYDDFFQKLEEKSPVDILVNNAGINIKKDYFDFTAEEFDKI